jgi:hypothetical protein
MEKQVINWEELANDFINSHVELYGIEDTLVRLFAYGLDKEQLEDLQFDRIDINAAYIIYMTQV